MSNYYKLPDNLDEVLRLKSMGRCNIVARDLWPAAFEPYEEWSSKIAEARCKARRSAQKLRDTDPMKFADIVRDTLRRAELKRLNGKST